MKKLATLLMLCIIAAGCSNDTQPTNEITKTPSVDQEQTASKNLFTSNDITAAKGISEQYISILVGFNGRAVRTSQQLDDVQKELTEKIKKQEWIFPDSSIYRTSDTKRSKDDLLELAAASLHIGDTIEEIYYSNIDAHELIVPMTYTKPGINKTFQYSLRFVKTLDNEIQLIKDGFYISGPDLKKKDNEAYEDSYKKTEIQQEVKQELRIK
ncbi:MAG: hypothetical protein ACQEXV_25270 [Bacillota bacterium]